MITAEMRSLIEAFPLGFVATVQPDGAPAVSPKGTFLVLDDVTVAFSNIRSPGTMRGIAHDPRVEVNFIDIFRRKGVRLAGMAQAADKGAEGFEAHFPRFKATWPDLAHRIRSIVTIEVTAARIVTTPPYDDGATEAEMIAAYKAKFAGMYP